MTELQKNRVLLSGKYSSFLTCSFWYLSANYYITQKTGYYFLVEYIPLYTYFKKPGTTFWFELLPYITCKNNCFQKTGYITIGDVDFLGHVPAIFYLFLVMGAPQAKRAICENKKFLADCFYITSKVTGTPIKITSFIKKLLNLLLEFI